MQRMTEAAEERAAIQDEACRRYCAECGEYKREDDGEGDVRWVCFECWRKTE